MSDVLVLDDVVVRFRTASGSFAAVAGVSLRLRAGETLSIVGESGSGKSTTALAAMGLTPLADGRVTLEGSDLKVLRGGSLRRARQRIGLVLQDPFASLNPRRRIADIVAEPLRIRGGIDRDELIAKVAAALDAVGLGPAFASRLPGELSGGQCQRVSIARALVAEPAVLVCDEAVSALDVSVQAQVLNLLLTVQREYRMSILFISHDLGVVRVVSDRVAVMYLGRVCELAPTESIYARPAHPYTTMLMDAAGDSEGNRLAPVRGEPPSPLDPPAGCRFNTRCPFATELCRTTEPQLTGVAPDHAVACHYPWIAEGAALLGPGVA